MQRVPDYMLPAILCTLFCCVPAGIVGIVYAAQANSKRGVGDYAGAARAAQAAKMWCWISFWSVAVIAVLALLAGALD